MAETPGNTDIELTNNSADEMARQARRLPPGLNVNRLDSGNPGNAGDSRSYLPAGSGFTTANAADRGGADDAGANQSAAGSPSHHTENAGNTPISLQAIGQFPDLSIAEGSIVTIGGLPPGTRLNHGSANADGSWTLSVADLTGLTAALPHHDNGAFNLTVTATAGNPAPGAAATQTFTFLVDPVAETPVLVVHNAAGTEDHATPLDLSAAVTAGDDSLSITIVGVPAGATLNHGALNADGSWTLGAGQLAGLTITTMPGNPSSFDLTVTATSHIGQSTASASAIVNVDLSPNAPTVTLAPAEGNENTAIPLSLNVGVPGAASGDTLAITIAGVPAGATLNHGTANADGTWTLTSADLNGLTVTPPRDNHDAFNLTVTATAQNVDHSVATTQSLAVTVDPMAQTPVLVAHNAAGTEDRATALNLSAAVTASDDTLSVTIAGVPAGATLNHGTQNSDGSWTLGANQLGGLTITTAPGNPSNFNLTVTATSHDGASTASTSASVNVDLKPNAPIVTVAPAEGNENTAIPLSLGASIPGAASDDTLSITISGVPHGATLNHGTQNANGTWTLTSADLTGLTITPAHNSDSTMKLTVTATAQNSDHAASAHASLSVTVDPIAETPVLVVHNATGTEDHATALHLTAALAQANNSETVSVTIAGVPAGATLNHGTQNADGTWTLSKSQLSGLTITTAPGNPSNFDLTVTATGHDGNSTASTGPILLNVDLKPNAPSVTVAPAEGNENSAIPLSLGASIPGAASGDTLSITISGVPHGATLNHGAQNANGTWTLTSADLAGLTITPAHNSDSTIKLTVTATAQNSDHAVSAHASLSVTVDPVAETPVLVVHNATGTEDHATALHLTAALAQANNAETVSVTIAGVPAGATLNHGTQNADGSWTLSASQLNGLKITTVPGNPSNFDLTVTATGNDGSSTASTGPMLLNVDLKPNAPIVTVVPAEGNENTAIPLNLGASIPGAASGDTLAITITGMPAGATLNHGTQNANGTWTLASADLTGLTITPAHNSDSTIKLTVTATAENTDHAVSAHASLSVTVDPVAETPVLVVQNAVGTEDHATSLNLTAALAETNNSETVSVTIAGVPAGATLNHGTLNADGSWTLSAAQLGGLTITTAPGNPSSFDLTVTATGHDGSSTVSTGAMLLNVDLKPNAPTVTVAPAEGNENTAIALNLAASVPSAASGDTLAITITGMPAGATLNQGTQNADGSWTLTSTDLAGLTVTPSHNSDSAFHLTVTATAANADYSAATTKTLAVTVDPVAETPTLVVQDATGTERHATPLNLTAALAEVNNSETVSVTISGVPAGAMLNHGTHNADGSWTLSSAQLAGLTITTAADSPSNFNLTVTATGHDGSSTASTGPALLNVDLSPTAPTLTTHAAQGNENSAIALNIAAAIPQAATDDTLSIAITGVPAGASLNHGTLNADGSWTLASADLAGLTITPPHNSHAEIQLSVTATAQNALHATSIAGSLDVTVTPVAETPVLVAQNATGIEAEPVSLDLSAALVDADSSETLAITISGVPHGAELNHGTLNSNGTWSLSGADLNGLTIATAAGNPSDFNLTVTATGHNGTASASTSTTLNVDLGPEAPVIDASWTRGTAGTHIALDLSASIPDAAAGDSLSVTIAGIPTGTTLNHGTHNADGSWTLTATQLSGLTLTAPKSSEAELDLTVSATASNAHHTTTTTQALTVIVDPIASAATETVGGVSEFVFGLGDGREHAFGGNGWPDTVDMSHSAVGTLGTNWTITLTQGNVVSQDAHDLVLSTGSAGVIHTSDGSELTFSGLAKVHW
jgi:hypothetical protein